MQNLYGDNQAYVSLLILLVVLLLIALLIVVVLWLFRERICNWACMCYRRCTGGPGPGGASERFIVQGQITQDRRAVAGVIAEVADRGLGAPRILGSAESDAQGNYSLTLQRSLLQGKPRPDIFVRVLDPRKNREVVAQSAVYYFAESPLEINVPIAPGDVVVLCEYDRLLAALSPLLHGNPIDGLTPDGIEYVANRSRWDARAVAMASHAERLNKLTQIPADHYYALMRAGLPSDRAALHSQADETVRRALGLAMDGNVITSEHSIDSTLVIHRREGLAALPNLASPAALSSLQDMLSLRALSDADKAKFYEAFRSTVAGQGDLWSSLAAAGFDAASVEHFRTDGKLGFLTAQNAQLVKSIQELPEFKVVDDLPRAGLYKSSNWLGLIGANIPRNTTALAYANAMAAQVNLAYPTLVAAEMVRRKDVIGVDASTATTDGEVAAFLRSGHGRHTIGLNPVKAWTNFNGLTSEGKQGAKLVERWHQLSPSNESMAVLAAEGLNSAHQITRQPLPEFLQKYGAKFPSQREAKLVYQKADEIHATALHLATTYVTYRGAPNVYALTGNLAKPQPLAAALAASPTLEDLLQNMDYCACEHCKSVLGPAAYFVDLLEFINPPGVAKADGNPRDVLFDRRPDMQNLQLSCENTNVAMPYIDLVNEILENYVVNRGVLGEDFGHNTLEESKSIDLMADPAYVVSAAYDKTKEKVYPHGLPFDMPLAALRLFMRTWGTTLDAALRVFGTPQASQREVLGLNAGELSILTNQAYRKLPEYFGEPAQTTLAELNARIAEGKTFCRRTGIKYEDLVAMLLASFINPGASLVPRLQRLRLTLAQVQSFLDGTLSEAELKNLIPVNLDLDEYEGGVAEWLRNNQPLIMELITLTDTGAKPIECNFATVELRYALPDPALNSLDEFAYQKLHRFIRLWKKLGWSIELTDKAIVTFLGMRPSALTLANMDVALSAMLSRLSNFSLLMSRLSTPEARFSEWLDAFYTGSAERLAQLLRIGEVDFTDFVKVTGLDPLADDMDSATPSMFLFLDAWNALRDMKLKVTDIVYLIRSQDDSGKLTPDASDLLRSIKTLRGALAIVDADLDPAQSGADLEFARNRMALVFSASVVDVFIGLVRASRLYSVPFATDEEVLPVKLVEADSALAFDPFKKELSFAGAMTASTATTLKTAADGLTKDDLSTSKTDLALQKFVRAFKVALDKLVAKGAQDLDAIWAQAPELEPIYLAVMAAPDAAARVKLLVRNVVLTLRGQLKQVALQSALSSILKLDAVVVGALTSGPAVLHANGNAAAGVLADLLALETQLPINSNRTYTLYVDPPTTEDFILYVSAPKRTKVSLRVGSTVVIDETVGNSGEVESDAQIAFTSGLLTRIELTLSSLPIDAAASLSWRARTIEKAPIPRERLLNEAAVGAARFSLLRLFKAVLLLQAMPLTSREIKHLFASGDTKDLLNDLDVDGSIRAVAQRALWKKLHLLSWFATLKKDQPFEDTWVAVLEQPDLKTRDGQLVLAGINQWTEDDLAEVLRRFRLTLPDLTSLPVLRRVKDAVDFVVATSLSARSLLAWSTDAPDGPLIDKIKAKLPLDRDPAAWRTILQSVNDALRNQRRDALVSYILHHQAPDVSIDTADKLYEYFLIDVEMDACMQTSRIRAALSTVQLFITRCLMNLEPKALATSINVLEWAWMKRYRVWEANRKVFLYPENWLEPELRDNKSPFFRELESELLKADITDELAEDAYRSYLKKLDEVARLEIVGTCLQERNTSNKADDILHVFGRTNGKTRQYYYRRNDGGDWSPWEKLSLAIEGETLFPVIWKGQLFVFWFTKLDKPKGAEAGPSFSAMADKPWANSALITVELSLSWAEYFGGKWVSAKSSELGRPIKLENLTEFLPEKLTLDAKTYKPTADSSERLVFRLYYYSYEIEITFINKNVPPVINQDAPRDANSLSLYNEYLLSFGSLRTTMQKGELHSFNREFEVYINQSGFVGNLWLRQTLLTKSEATDVGFRVRPLMHRVKNQIEGPLFYSDERCIFAVTPSESIGLVTKYDGYYLNDSPATYPPPPRTTIPPVDTPPVKGTRPKPGDPEADGGIDNVIEEIGSKEVNHHIYDKNGRRDSLRDNQ